MTILPLRNLLLVHPLPLERTRGPLVVVSDPSVARPAEVIAVGPEVRDLTVGQTAIINSVAGTVIGEYLLLPETAVLGTL